MLILQEPNGLNLQQLNALLSKGYPSSPVPDDFPFAKYLEKLSVKYVEYPQHGVRVLDAMNCLLGGQSEAIIADPPAGYEALSGAIATIKHKLFRGEWDRNTEALLRIAALYHDIGKCIIKERHPTVGWYILEHIEPDERAKLVRLLQGAGNRAKRYLQTLMILVRDHDRFGTLCTGEASYPILLQTADSAGYDPKERQQVLSCLMLCNLADIAGLPQLPDGMSVLDRSTVDTVLTDWDWFRTTVGLCSTKGKDLEKEVIEAASKEKLVIERIHRLLREASRRWPERHAELDDEDLIRNALNTVFPTAGMKAEFCRQFTRVCKLDYGKRFFEALVEYCEGPALEHDARSTLHRWSKNRKGKVEVVYAVLGVLKRITSSYAAMIRSDTGTGNLIGVEMKDLTPEGFPDKTARIIELILDDHYPGLTWLISDVTAWYF
jgi:hypothetical protein